MQWFSTRPFSAAAGAAAAGLAFLLLCPTQRVRVAPNVACGIVPSSAIAAVAGRPLRVAAGATGECRYLGAQGDLEIVLSVVDQPPELPFGSPAASVNLPGGHTYVVRVRDGNLDAQPEHLAAQIADLAAQRTAAHQ